MCITIVSSCAVILVIKCYKDVCVEIERTHIIAYLKIVETIISSVPLSYCYQFWQPITTLL